MLLCVVIDVNYYYQCITGDDPKHVLEMYYIGEGKRATRVEGIIFLSVVISSSDIAVDKSLSELVAESSPLVSNRPGNLSTSFPRL